MNVTSAGLPPCRLSALTLPQACGSKSWEDSTIQKAQEAIQSVGALRARAQLRDQLPKVVLDHDYTNSLNSFPTMEDINLNCHQMLTAIEKTLVQAPALAAVFPHLKNLVARERRVLACDGREFARVQRISRECLGQLAKVWGYNHPQWLCECLPLIGYTQKDLQGSLSQFSKSEHFVNAMPTICQHAILAGNLESLNTALDFVPTAAMECMDFAPDDEPSWGFLYFAHKKTTPATRLILQNHWSLLEFSGFASCYGTTAAETLRSISPAYDEKKEQMPTNTREELFAIWAFREPGTPSEVILDRLIFLAKKQLSIYKMPLSGRFREQLSPHQTVSENLLRCFPFHLMSWGLAERSDAPNLSPSQWHQKLLGELDVQSDPQHSSEISSIFQALAQFLYNFGTLAGDLKAFCKLYLDETVGALKSRLDFQDLIDQTPVDNATLQLSGFRSEQLRCFLSGTLVCVFLAQFYRIQVHFCCLLQLPQQQIEDLLVDLKWHLELLGLAKDGLEVDQSLVDRQGKTALSLLVNASCKKRCEIFAIDRLVEVNPLERSAGGEFFSKSDQIADSFDDQVKGQRRFLPVIAYSWRSDPPFEVKSVSNGQQAEDPLCVD